MSKLLILAALLVILYVIGKRLLASPRPMGKRDAARLLGVSTDADAVAVAEAHRRLIAKVHPDAGGSAELAARINEARDIMLK
ncbi:MAG: J domain-containing protein [Sphingomonadaceae bacterium]